MLNNLWSKCNRITRFNLLPCIKNQVLIFRFVKAGFACTGTHTINSSCKALAITANDRVQLNQIVTAKMVSMCHSYIYCQQNVYKNIQLHSQHVHWKVEFHNNKHKMHAPSRSLTVLSIWTSYNYNVCSHYSHFCFQCSSWIHLKNSS